MNLFIPITKIDAQKRLVYGVLTEEVPDKSGEIIDYDSTKAAYQKWSSEAEERSQGKSKGNLRAMHSNIAAGKFTDISFDDENKRIEGVAKVVDDDEWNKVVEGVYAGFSHGGDYAKRWKDPTNPHLTRYTPELAEVSLVDNPCCPTSTFEFIKEDGSTELRKFNSPKEELPMTTATADTAPNETEAMPQNKGGVEQVWKAKDGTTHVSKAEALKRNEEVDAQADAAPVLEALAKMDAALTKGEKKADDEEGDADMAKKAKDKEAAAEEDADKAKKAEEEEDAEKTKKAKKEDGGDAEKSKKADDAEDEKAEKADGEDDAEKAKKKPTDDEEEEDDSEKAKKDGEADKKSKKAAEGEMKKGLWQVSQLAGLLDSLSCLEQQCELEAALEGDGSAVPAELTAHVKALSATLRAMVEEETAELTDEQKAEKMTSGELAKAGARHGAADKERVQKLHDDAHEMHKCMGDIVDKCADMHKGLAVMKNTAIDLGAEGEKADEQDDGKADKAVAVGLTKMTAENAALRKVLTDLTPKMEAMLKRVEAQNDRIDHLERQPMPAKGAVRAVEKGASAPSDEDVLKKFTGMSKADQDMLLMKAALSSPSQIME